MSTKSKVLLVDDDESLLKLLTIRLLANNYEVSTANCASDALSELQQQHFDVLLTDLRMDDIDGMQLAEQVQQLYPTMPVVMMTAHGSIPDAVKATKQGVFAFLTKPIDKDELIDTLAKAVRLHGHSQGQQSNHHGIVTRSATMHHLLEQVRMVGAADVNVLISGASGTGKELLAKAVHENSNVSDGPFVAINCGAVPAELLESQLFGHKKGAFTGATTDHVGLFSQAEGGTLFLDEIGDMPLNLQVKLLRVLQEKTIRPVGHSEEIPVNVRVVSATHKDLPTAISENTFREDLYYRLNVVNLRLPALNERREDISLLAHYFCEQIAARQEQAVKRFSDDAMDLLLRHDWPGNIRQLQNVVEQVVALSPSELISAKQVALALQCEMESSSPIALNEAKKQFEREYLIRVLKMVDGNVAQAAKLAKRNRSDFYKLIKKHDIDAEQFAPSASK
ncbi:Transcriptional regulatory protein QseF [Pseudoalteromonas sp. THAF3]|uniref:sigma-54-dependent transcriptional regulator n=1 Tax=Pseudoalteromonas TaxID=53246 RepID=UPI00034C9FB8|nr:MULTISPECIES: sigma 54-interacting transcriptional regulator [Pseudoalteromonas]MCF2862857.1 sigma 54-interacting transcriptional regulator [Pseudoalteromonas sp. CNAT2-18]MCG7543445.1 sigma 54-interacting transcriptional regulator [Pseudoalteromonas sp. MM17-2]MCG7558691.1 sigma 54-interacting transcriptional regulator [Pseudoalteromonas sp. CNAT2-18.1]MCG7567147.1 sigma 54-interacting transcriptional regulator [Pseudoalteromonas sp. CnMc7-15]MCG7570729.1 sigma 54-interacting transcription|tara:strand:- start:53035 stop:54387 length:1353 start_codon:yes stop_codon:yes gene_type:complete